MSVSVTVHEIGPASSPGVVVTNPLADLEAVRKNANEKLRIRRLVQVRQQSKELAAKVRQNYQQAKVKELAKIEQTKRDELQAWKRKHIRQLQDEYARCVGEVGEAHRAAEAAEECAVWFEEKRATQQAVALQRGRKAEETVARERERKDALREAKARKKPYVPSKSIAVQATLPEPKLEPVVREVMPPAAGEDISSPETTVSAYEQFRSRRKSAGRALPSVGHGAGLSESEDESFSPGMGNKENVPGTGQDYSATAFTSPSDMRPVEQPSRQRLQPFTQITELIQQRRQKQQQQQHNRPDESIVEQQQQQQRAALKPSAGGLYGSYGTQKAVQFDDISENTLSFPTSSVLTRDDHRPQGGSVPPPIAADGSPRKVRPRKLVEQPKVSPAVQPNATSVSKRGQAVLPSGVVPETSASSASYGASTKVQYYDYNSRYTKEYDQPVAFVHREERRTADPTAMEEANRYEKLQQELAAARSKSTVDRTRPALEKQQTRKDYEKLSKELDNLTRSENKLKSLAVPSKTIPTEVTIKAKAEARQRKANEAIENLLQQRALVTCPVVRQETTTYPRRSRSGSRAPVVNVAEMRSDACAPPSAPGKNVSSDSCTSIVLGTFDRPGIPLPTGDDGGRRDEGALDGGVDKIGRLKELLDQINEQRRLLTEELAKEQAEPIVGGVEEMCAAMRKNTEADKLERMKRRQEELLEQQSLLQKREREVEELERQLRDKMAQLRKNKQQREGEPAPKAASGKRSATSLKTAATTVHVETGRQKDAIEVDVEQPSTTTSTSDSIEGGEHDRDSVGRARDIPVKIIITVNDKSTPPKKKHKKKLAKKKSPKAVPLEPPKVTVAEPQRAEKPVDKEQPQPVPKVDEVARPKKGPVGRVVGMDFSPGSTSTTSTVYRELPPKIGRLKINSVLADAPVVDANTAPAPAPAGPKYQLQREAPIVKSSSKGPKEKPAPPTASAQEANLNPQLVKYIVRLLGMSRQSIDQLGVSSTTVSTPNASVVNVSSNVGGATEGPANDETDRMNRLRQFIDENYNFLQEIDETLKRASDQSTLGSGDSRVDSVDDRNDVSRVEDVWMRTLRKREKGMRKNRVEKNAPAGAQDPASATGSKSKSKKKRTEVTHVVTAVPPLAPVVAPPVPVERPLPAAAGGAPSQVVPALGDTGPSLGGTSGSRIVAKEASLKSILKSPKRDASPKVAKIITPQGHVEIINLSDREEQEILGRYSQLTERCSQRITELSQMIAQVREEKRRLIEDSLSSLEQQESTKYMDLPVTIHPAGGREIHPRSQPQPPQPPPAPVEDARPGSVAPGATPSPSGGGVPVLDDPASEEIDNIFSSKQIGLSKDSGIAMSRPLTASDIRESPSEECSQGKEPLPFEPFLKDIHKPVPSMGRPGGPPAGGPSLVGSVPVVGVVGTRKPPPVAITRYSPQLDELPVHELSTILEVDTPAVAAGSASRVYDVSSLSAAGERSDTAKEMVLIEARNRLLLEPPSSPNIAYDRFPDYEEYVRPDGATGSPVRIDLEQTEPAACGNETSGLRLDLTEEREPGRLQYRSFPGAAPSFDITEDEPGSRAAEKSQSDASLPDVVAELAKFNIILKPFDHSLDNSNRSTPLSREEHGASSQRRPTNDKPAVGQRKPAPARPDLELSDSLGRDLESVPGLGWVSAMLKKNQETKRQHHQPAQLQAHSSSSSLSFDASKGQLNNGADDSHDGGSGKPPNLAKFIARELMVRTQSDLQSISSSSELSSSPGAHSALLRSLLSISNLEHTSRDGSSAGETEARLTTTGATMNNVQRTSTPVASKSTTGSGGGGSSTRLAAGPSDAADSGAGNNRTLFSGESRISSVHWSSSSGSSERHSHGLSAPDVRLERRSSVSQSLQGEN